MHVNSNFECCGLSEFYGVNESGFTLKRVKETLREHFRVVGIGASTIFVGAHRKLCTGVYCRETVEARLQTIADYLEENGYAECYEIPNTRNRNSANTLSTMVVNWTEKFVTDVTGTKGLA